MGIDFGDYIYPRIKRFAGYRVLGYRVLGLSWILGFEAFRVLGYRVLRLCM